MRARLTVLLVASLTTGCVTLRFESEADRAFRRYWSQREVTPDAYCGATAVSAEFPPDVAASVIERAMVVEQCPIQRLGLMDALPEGDLHSVDVLAIAARDTYRDVRRKAMSRLVALGSPEAVAALQNAAQSHRPAVRAEAQAAIDAIVSGTSADFVDRMEEERSGCVSIHHAPGDNDNSPDPFLRVTE